MHSFTSAKEGAGFLWENQAGLGKKLLPKALRLPAVL